MMVGGYDDGYAACEWCWGREPGSLVRRLVSLVAVGGLRILDLGCGEGKNAVYLARLGAKVTAVEVSALALANAERAWHDRDLVAWTQEDARTVTLEAGSFDVVIMYG